MNEIVGSLCAKILVGAKRQIVINKLMEQRFIFELKISDDAFSPSTAAALAFRRFSVLQLLDKAVCVMKWGKN